MRHAHNHFLKIKSLCPGTSGCHIILAGLRFWQGDINGDTTFMLSFQHIQDIGIPEGNLSNLSRLLTFLPFSNFLMVNQLRMDSVVGN
jgi:hypothetical protein